eukprot:1142553-Pelagomonas_calceolata.AAC.7
MVSVYHHQLAEQVSLSVIFITQIKSAEAFVWAWACRLGSSDSDPGNLSNYLNQKAHLLGSLPNTCNPDLVQVGSILIDEPNHFSPKN